jgi:uridine kinase
MTKPYTIGITGGSGSGKTFFIHQLASMFRPGDVCLLSQDNYYKPKHLQYIDAQGIENFDLPDAIDRTAFIEDILRIKRGENVVREEYTFNNPQAKPKLIEYSPAPLLIVEGLFIFGYAEIEKELDLRVFIEAKDHIKLTRRIRRDNQERGYDLTDVLYRYENHVMPVYESQILPLRATADLIIPNNQSFDRALKLLATALRVHIK